MRTRVIAAFPETALERLLEALESELVAATDEEILEAAHDLGMKPEMKGSAAFIGLKYPSARRRADFFDPQWMLRVLNDPRRILLASEALPPGTPAAAATPPRVKSQRVRSRGRRPAKSPRSDE